MFQLTFALFNGLSTGMAVFLVAAGLTLVFGILKIMNFSHGAFFMVGAYVAFTLIGGETPSVFQLLLVTLAAAAVVGALGWITDSVVLKRLAGVDEHYILIATFALLMIVRGATKLIWGVDFHSVSQPEPLSGVVMVGDVPVAVYSLLIMAVGVVVFLMLDLAIRRLWVGKVIQSIANDRWMTALLGYNVPALFTGTVVVAFALAGMAGGLLLPNQGLSPELGDTFVMLCFIVCIIGGMGSIRGAFVAAILLGLVDGLSAIYLSAFPGIGLYLFLIVVLLVRPQGLSGGGEDGPTAAAMGNLFGSVRRRMSKSDTSAVTTVTETTPADFRFTERPVARMHLMAAAIIIAILALAPFYLGSSTLFIAGLAVIQAVFSLTWFLLFRYGGVASFGHAAFFAIGAYGVAVAMLNLPTVYIVPLFLAVGVFGALVAGLLGIVALRRASGLHLAILTMALSEILKLFIGYSAILGRDDGLSGIPRPLLHLGFTDVSLASDRSYFWFILVICSLLAAALWWVMNSRFGRALKCISQDPERAAFIGIDVFRYRLGAFMISAGAATICGGLMSPFAQIVTPELASLHNSMAPILNTLLGGASSFWGPFLGATIFSGITFATRTLAGMADIVVGVILLVVILAAPTGIMGLVDAAFGKLRGRRATKPADATATTIASEHSA